MSVLNPTLFLITAILVFVAFIGVLAILNFAVPQDFYHTIYYFLNYLICYEIAIIGRKKTERVRYKHLTFAFDVSREMKRKTCLFLSFVNGRTQ